MEKAKIKSAAISASHELITYSGYGGRGKIAIRPAVELSYLPKEQQRLLTQWNWRTVLQAMHRRLKCGSLQRQES